MRGYISESEARKRAQRVKAATDAEKAREIAHGNAEAAHLAKELASKWIAQGREGDCMIEVVKRGGLFRDSSWSAQTEGWIIGRDVHITEYGTDMSTTWALGRDTNLWRGTLIVPRRALEAVPVETANDCLEFLRRAADK
jgi:hypothetical protein